MVKMWRNAIIILIPLQHILTWRLCTSTLRMNILIIDWWMKIKTEPYRTESLSWPTLVSNSIFCLEIRICLCCQWSELPFNIRTCVVHLDDLLWELDALFMINITKIEEGRSFYQYNFFVLNVGNYEKIMLSKRNIAETRDYSEPMRTLRIWTRDLQIFSLTLSQLSYLGNWFSIFRY